MNPAPLNAAVPFGAAGCFTHNPETPQKRIQRAQRLKNLAVEKNTCKNNLNDMHFYLNNPIIQQHSNYVFWQTKLNNLTAQLNNLNQLGLADIRAYEAINEAVASQLCIPMHRALYSTNQPL